MAFDFPSNVVFEPHVGDYIEFLSDSQCDRGPCQGEVLSVEPGRYAIVDVSGGEPYETLVLSQVFVESVEMPKLADTGPRVRTWTLV